MILTLAGPKSASWLPAPTDPGARRNDESLVMKLAYGKTSALLEGDAENRSERQIADEQPEADLLKVAHHGSATSTIPLLLERVHPRFAVISVGARNTYGHPREGSSCPAGRSPRADLPYRSRRGGHVLSGRHNRHSGSFSGGSPLISISAVSSLPGARRYSSMTRRARSASSSRTRMTVPPTPGRMSCCGVERRNIGIDSGGLEQAVHDQGFGFLFRVENSHQLFVRIGARGGTFVHRSSDRGNRRERLPKPAWSPLIVLRVARVTEVLHLREVAFVSECPQNRPMGRAQRPIAAAHRNEECGAACF